MRDAFTPAQQDFYDALNQADRQVVEIARDILEAFRPGVMPQPEAFDAPTHTPQWVALEHTSQRLRSEIGDDKAAVDVALTIVRTVLAQKRER